MRGIATGDLHLGYRAHAATMAGRNTRETDVERAFAAAVDRVIEHDPDLLTISGDCFHHPRVGMHAVVAFRDGIRRVIDETDAHVVVISGNHDLGRTAEVLTPVAIARGYDRVHVALTPQRIRIRLALGEVCAIAAFPPVARAAEETVYALEPDATADVNLLLIHAAVRGHAEGGVLPSFYAGEESLDVAREVDRWDVVHVGDFHQFTRLHPTALAFYTGSIERTSSNIWEEHAPKGVVLYDTRSGDLEFSRIPTREMADYDLGDFDLPPGADVEQVNGVLRKMLTFGHLRGAIVRLKVDGFRREDRDALDFATVRQLKHTCLHFQLDLRFAKRESMTIDRRERPTRGLLDEAHDFFAADDESVRTLALSYLGE